MKEGKPTLIDDALDAFGCHGVGGIFGGLMTGLFAQAAVGGADGLFYGNPAQFGAQFAGIMLTIGWTVADSPKALTALADAREKLADIMRNDAGELGSAGAGGPEAGKETASDLNYFWSAIICAIWGREVLTTGGAKLIKAAPADRKPFYERIFAK